MPSTGAASNFHLIDCEFKSGLLVVLCVAIDSDVVLLHKIYGTYCTILWMEGAPFFSLFSKYSTILRRSVPTAMYVGSAIIFYSYVRTYVQ